MVSPDRREAEADCEALQELMDLLINITALHCLTYQHILPKASCTSANKEFIKTVSFYRTLNSGWIEDTDVRVKLQ